MKKPNNQFIVCKGINSAISILSSGRYDVNHVDILKGGRAFKDDSIKPFLRSFNFNILEKEHFYKKHPGDRSQGIVITFQGSIISNDIPEFNNEGDVCLLALDQIEDPQNFGQISVSHGVSDLLNGATGRQYEIEATVSKGSADRIGFKLFRTC